MLLTRLRYFLLHTFERYRSYLIRLSKRRSRQGLYEFLKDQYSRFPADARVLTVGAGGEVNELLKTYAAANGFHIVALDIDQSRGPDIVGDICVGCLADSRFDAVVLCEVLEHLKSPRQGLTNVNRMLKPGGKLIVSAPFVFPIHDQPQDYYRFTRYGLELLLKDFRDVIVTERNSYFEVIDVLWMRLLIEKSHRAVFLACVLVPIIFFIKRPVTILLTRLIPLTSMATGYTAIAVKQYNESTTQVVKCC